MCMHTLGTRNELLQTTPLQATFRDGLGTRYLWDGPGGPLEVLTLHPHLGAVQTFEALVQERVTRLAQFRQPCYSHVRDVERDADASRLAVVSDQVAGVRLSRMLAIAEQNLLPLDVDSSLCLIRQLLSAVATLHEATPDTCHGALAPERIVITPDARLVLVEHVFSAALEELQWSSERYWKDLRIALPPDGEYHFTRRGDVFQAGTIALGLLLGRPLGEEEYPASLSELANGTFGLGGGFEQFPHWLRSWLSRALWLDPSRTFASAADARQAFESGLASDGSTAAPSALEAFLAQYRSSVDGQAVEAPVSKAAEVPARKAMEPPARRATEVLASKAVEMPASKAAEVPASKVVEVPSSKPMEVPASKATVPAQVAAAPAPRPAAHASTPSAPVVNTVIRPLFARDEEIDVPHTSKGRTGSAGKSRRPLMIAASVALVALMSGGTMAARRYLAASPAAAPATGTLAIQTNPAGASVVIDGQANGVTPLSVSLSAGPHTLELTSNGVHRTIPITMAARAELSQFIEMPQAAAVVGQLDVRTDPAGARVSVDGQRRGVSPVTVTGLTAGSHTVMLENELGSVNQDVTIEPGGTASLVVPMRSPQGAPVSGWISISAPAELQVFENQRLLGSTRTERIMVATGRHDLEFVNEALGYRSAKTIQVGPGLVANVKPDWPQGTIAINAAPWANVWLDGQELGETPVGNTQVPIGTHEVVFRHPQFGEQRYTTTVTATTPARLSVDMRKK
jgi:PEGA domain-containing protein